MLFLSNANLVLQHTKEANYVPFAEVNRKRRRRRYLNRGNARVGLC